MDADKENIPPQDGSMASIVARNPQGCGNGSDARILAKSNELEKRKAELDGARSDY